MKKMLHALLDQVELPRVFRYTQSFPDECLDDIPATLARAWAACPAAKAVRPGMRVALSVGSRGIAELPVLVAAIAARVRACGAEPFVVPAMGSHGGATAEGQKALLAGLGVTESSAGCPILSSMETPWKWAAWTTACPCAWIAWRKRPTVSLSSTASSRITPSARPTRAGW